MQESIQDTRYDSLFLKNQKAYNQKVYFIHCTAIFLKRGFGRNKDLKANPNANMFLKDWLG